MHIPTPSAKRDPKKKVFLIRNGALPLRSFPFPIPLPIHKGMLQQKRQRKEKRRSPGQAHNQRFLIFPLLFSFPLFFSPLHKNHRRISFLYRIISSSKPLSKKKKTCLSGFPGISCSELIKEPERETKERIKSSHCFFHSFFSPQMSKRHHSRRGGSSGIQPSLKVPCSRRCR